MRAVTDADVDALQERLKLRLKSERLYEALTHPSFVNEHPGTTDHTRLAFLGDAVLGVMVASELYRLPEKPSKGAMTDRRRMRVNNKRLAGLAEKLALPVRVGNGVGLTNRVLADTMEAVVGAVYEEHGHDAAAEFVNAFVPRAEES